MYRRKRRKENERDRAAVDALQAENPNMYRHPAPFATNPYWQTEINLGPAPHRKKRAPTTESQRPLKTAGTQSSAGSGHPSSTDVSRGYGSDGRYESRRDIRLYQREDEELWGSMASDALTHRNMDSSASFVSALTRPATARTNQTTSTSYHSARNPAINDMIPPVVTKVENREDIMWMLQPPPIAAVMSGKERTTRSRSNSGTSRSSTNVAPENLSRNLSKRLMQNKLRNTEASDLPSLSRASSARTATATGPSGQRHDRSSPKKAGSDGGSSTEDLHRKRSKRRPPPIQISEDSTISATTIVRRPNLAPDPPEPRRVASRPRLSTIVSDSILSADAQEPAFHTPRELPTENTPPEIGTEDSPRAQYASRVPSVKDSSLNVLQELVPASALLNAKVLSTPPPTVEAKIRLPPVDGAEERRLSGFDSWYTSGDFDIPGWVESQVKGRNVGQRWSMDI